MMILHHADMLFALTASGVTRHRVDTAFAKFTANPSSSMIDGKLIDFPPPSTCMAFERTTKLKNLLTMSPLNLASGIPLDPNVQIKVTGNGGERLIEKMKNGTDYSVGVGRQLARAQRCQLPALLSQRHVSHSGRWAGGGGRSRPTSTSGNRLSGRIAPARPP
ncbi:MAG: hypothetical protein WDO18_17660 [Acidobacteriota bacterium]